MTLSQILKKYGVEDLKAISNISCCVLGLGSLALVRGYAKAGPVYATIGLFLMCFINIYSTAAISRCMMRAPIYVQTYGDLGEYVWGTSGRYLVVVTQFCSCLITPIAFLVLGGSQILPNIFNPLWPNATANHYIPLMALCLLPVVLIRTLKEAAWVALIGAAGTFFGDLLAVLDSYMTGPTVVNASTNPTFMNVASVFGSLSLAFGAGVVIPGIQRDMKKPEHMPFNIAVSLSIITLVYLLMGVLGYVQYGCAAPANLLRSMYNRKVEIAAQVFFLSHVVIAYAVLLNPALYIFERKLLGFYTTFSRESGSGHEAEYGKLASPAVLTIKKVRQFEKDQKSFQAGRLQDRVSYLAGKRSVAASFSGELDLIDDDSNVPFTMKDRLKSCALRVTVVVMQVFIAMILQSCFDELADLVGASGITLSCILLPLGMYLKMFPDTIKTPERIVCYVIIVVCSILGAISTVLSVIEIVKNIQTYELFHSLATDGDGVDIHSPYCHSNQNVHIMNA